MGAPVFRQSSKTLSVRNPRVRIRAVTMTSANDRDPLRPPDSGFSFFGWTRQRKGQVKASSADSDVEGARDPLISSKEAPEMFTWSSVILPFLFPALGGVLFGYDIGATSGASVSLQSAELSGTTWTSCAYSWSAVIWTWYRFGYACSS